MTSLTFLLRRHLPFFYGVTKDLEKDILVYKYENPQLPAIAESMTFLRLSLLHTLATALKKYKEIQVKEEWFVTLLTHCYDVTYLATMTSLTTLL